MHARHQASTLVFFLCPPTKVCVVCSSRSSDPAQMGNKEKEEEAESLRLSLALKNNHRDVGEMSQLGKHLPSKRKDLSSNPGKKTHIRG